MSETTIKSYYGGRYEIRSELELTTEQRIVKGNFKNTWILLALIFVVVFGATLLYEAINIPLNNHPTELQQEIVVFGAMSALICFIMILVTNNEFRREEVMEGVNVYEMSIRVYSRVNSSAAWENEITNIFTFLPEETRNAKKQTKEAITELESDIKLLESRKTEPVRRAKIHEELLHGLKESVQEPATVDTNRFTDLDTNDYGE